MALSWQYAEDILPMDDTVDCPIKLPLQPGPAGDEWPSGTKAYIRFYNGTTMSPLAPEIELSVSPQLIGGQIESEVVQTIPDASVFKIWAVMPGNPTTEAPLWAGRVEKKVY